MSIIDRLLKRDPRLVVVVATRHDEALAALAELGQAKDTGITLEQREAFTTGGVYDALPGAHLAVVDLPGLVETGGVGRGQLATTLVRQGVVPHADGEQFAADPETWLETARAALGVPAALPPRTAAFVGLSGGVGKTTLALDTAVHFRDKLNLPAAVVELSFGPGGQAALLGHPEWPHLYEIVTQGAPPPTWRGVTLVPMTWDTARLLSPEQVSGRFQEVARRHILTLVEGHAAHPFWPALRPLCQAIYVVSDGRLDALAGAVYLADLERQHDGHGSVQLVLNRAGALARLGRLEPAVSLPAVGRPDRFEGKLGRRMMPALYSGWKGRVPPKVSKGRALRLSKDRRLAEGAIDVP